MKPNVFIASAVDALVKRGRDPMEKIPISAEGNIIPLFETSPLYMFLANFIQTQKVFQEMFEGKDTVSEVP